jgi:hypothetical protein
MKPMESKLVSFPSVGKSEVLTAPDNAILKEKLDILEIQVGNSTGADASCGWGVKVSAGDWKAGQWDVSEDPEYIDDTIHAQDVAVNNFALTTTTNNDGFVVQSKLFPNVIRIDVGTAAAGGSPAYTYKYFNGTGFATLTTVLTPNLAATGDQYLVSLTPHDAAVVGAANADGLAQGHFAILVQATTAPTSTAALADEIGVVHLMDFIEKVGDGNATVEEYNPGTKQVQPGQALVPFCSAANAANWVKVKYTKSV